MSVKLQRITRAPHCANVVWPDLGLGQAFLDEVERAVTQIVAYPEAVPLVNRTVRKKPVRRFPYSVMYSIRAEGIHILAIAHQHRRPFYWRGRQ